MQTLIDLGGDTGRIPEARVRAHLKLWIASGEEGVLQREIRICLPKEEENKC